MRSELKQLANLTSSVTAVMGSAVGNFSLNQTMEELTNAATNAIQVGAPTTSFVLSVLPCVHMSNRSQLVDRGMMSMSLSGQAGC